jgi:hypothetical protein
MSNRNPLTEIVMAAANLKAAAPQHFAALVDAIRAYEKQAIVDMVSGDQPHEIFRAQGGVKIISALRKQLVECTELRDQYQRRS